MDREVVAAVLIVVDRPVHVRHVPHSERSAVAPEAEGQGVVAAERTREAHSRPVVAPGLRSCRTSGEIDVGVGVDVDVGASAQTMSALAVVSAASCSCQTTSD